MGNSEKEAEQLKTKNLTSQSAQTNQNPVNVREKEKSVLNNASEPKTINCKKLGNHLKEQNSLKDSIINFSLEGNVLVKKLVSVF